MDLCSVPAVLPFFGRPSSAGTGSALFSAQPLVPSFIWRPWRVPAPRPAFHHPGRNRLRRPHCRRLCRTAAESPWPSLPLARQFNRCLGRSRARSGTRLASASRRRGPVPFRAILAVSIFAAVSALFHLFVMRRGVFLSGHGRSLCDDFRRIPRLIAGLVVAAVTLLSALAGRATRAAESEAAL